MQERWVHYFRSSPLEQAARNINGEQPSGLSALRWTTWLMSLTQRRSGSRLSKTTSTPMTPRRCRPPFAPQEAKRILDKLNHYTPVHGSWLSRAEAELRFFARQWLDRRLPDPASWQRETLAWEQRRPTQLQTLDWRVAPEAARVELKRLYPSFQPRQSASLSIASTHPATKAGAEGCMASASRCCQT